MPKISGWGRYPKIEARIKYASSIHGITSDSVSGLCRGLGRSYGDSALSESIILTDRLNHFISFDNTTGELHCEAGVSLADILETFVPLGWFLYVTPGTKFVTVGGAIASDVHGKNHHLNGSFSEHISSLTLIIKDQEIDCSRHVNAELFHATCGGMGLTGVIKSATLKLKQIDSSFINQKSIKATNLKKALELFEEHRDVTYSVAWIDCLSSGSNLGRSILMLGEHDIKGDLIAHNEGNLNIPCDFPSFFLNKYTIQAFNFAYYNKQRTDIAHQRIHYNQFFYPLDGIKNWNRMYGKKGFTQYQFVIPKQAGLEALSEIIQEISESKQGSFLAVLKVLGKQNSNYLSFPIEGYTLALDFKINSKVLELLDRLDIIVEKYKGRLYLAKDARMSESMFKETYPQWQKFNDIRKKYGADVLYNSLQSKRLGL